MDFRRIRTDLLALGLFALAVFAGMSLVSYDPADPPSSAVYPARTATINLCGERGAEFAHHLRTGFGMGAYFLLLTLVAVDMRLFRREAVTNAVVRTVGVLLSLIGLCVALQLTSPGMGDGPVIGSGGYLGVFAVSWLELHFSTAGTVVLCGTLFAAGLILSGDIVLFTGALRAAAAPL
ncbi:MAG: DNA translocase FtsK 4TM domain-containing protein, partial [Planctomycetes bacterium]|nr:DNA translocase FtsK 4TM domain-containing protein [Planctomycetota bacterium]